MAARVVSITTETLRHGERLQGQITERVVARKR